MDMDYEHFMESMATVPPELERNFTLIKDLDGRTEEVMGRINECIVQYKASRSRSDRKRIQETTKSLFNEINSFAEDKHQLSLQTYEIVDKKIKRLVSLGDGTGTTSAPEQEASEPAKPLGFDMPTDEHEPRYCLCRNVSYGEMIACENKECETEWFHYPCVGITVAPKGKWYCGNCLPQAKARYRKNVTKRRRR